MNFTNEEINNIINDYKNKINIDDIISKYGCEERDIRIILKENQIDRKYNSFEQELLDRICEKYKSGKLMKEIRYDLLVSDTGIRKIVDREKIPRQTHSHRNQRFPRNSHYFDKIDTPNKAYVLGMLYADGCNHTDHNAINLQLQEEDYPILLRIKLELEYQGELRKNNLHDKNKNYKNQYILCINDEYMSNQLLSLGLVPRKSLILKFPTEEQVPEKYISHFIRGYFDGDGCISSYNNKYTTGICGTYEFVSGIGKLLSSMNIKHNIYHPKQSGESNTYVIQTSGNKSTYEFMHWLYKDSDLKMERKYYRYLDLCNYYNKIA